MNALGVSTRHLAVVAVAAVGLLGCGSSAGEGERRASTAAAVAACSQPTLTATTGGTAITLGALAACPGAAAEFRFLGRAPGATTWIEVRSWGGPQHLWETAALPSGTWTVSVQVRSAGATAVESAASFAVRVGAVCASATIASARGAGATIDLSATAACSGAPAEFRFLGRAPGATTWTELRGWGGTQHPWDTAAVTPGVWAVAVHARVVGNRSAVEASATGSAVVGAVCTSATIAAARGTGWNVNLTGNAICPGASGAEFQFLARAPGAAGWTVVRGWGGAQYPWDTAPLQGGAWSVAVQARAVGNRSGAEAARTITWAVPADVTAPVTTPSLAGGVYGPGRSVALACADDRTGCAGTYYTTDGSPPSTSSSLYAGPIPLDASFTLRWLSVDRAGNAETPGAADYVVDAAGPAVSSVTPGAGEENVPVASAVTVTFGEPMDVAATAAAIRLDGTLSGPVSGDVTADGEGRAFTFTPRAPLAGAETYVLTVSATARDLAGNALAPWSSSFTTRPPWDVLSGPGSATITSARVAFDGAGNGLAAWTVDYRIYWAHAPAGGTWSGPRLLTETEALSGGPAVRVAAAASGFLLAWSTGGKLQATFVDSGGNLGTTTTFWQNASNTWANQLDVASNGTGYAVVGIEYGTGYPRAAVWSGTAWGAWATLSYTHAPNLVDVAARGTGYVMIETSGGYVMLSEYAGGAWSTPTATLASTFGTAAVDASASLICITAVEPSTGRAAVRAGSLSSALNAYVTPVGSGTATATAVAVSGSRCAAVAGAGNAPYGVVYGGSTFSAPVALSQPVSASDAVSVAPVGTTGFVAAARVAARPNVIVNATQSWAWGAYAGHAEYGGAEARAPIAAANGIAPRVGFLKPDLEGDHLWLRPFDDAGFGPVERVTNPVAGTAAGVSVATNAAGDAVAVWQQEDLGVLNVFAAVRAGGSWGLPEKLEAGAGSPAVASNGTDFAVAYVGSLVGTSGFARRLWYASGAWSDPFTITTALKDGLRLASDGTGFALTGLAPNRSAWVTFHTPRSWTGPMTLTGAGNTAGMVPAVAGRAGEYLFVWSDVSATYVRTVMARRATGALTAWQWATPVQLGAGGTEGPAVAAGPSGFGVAWHDDASTVLGRVFQSGGWSATATLRSATACRVGVASDGATYAVGSACNGGLHVNGWSGGTWGTPRPVFNPSTTLVEAFAVASGGGAYGFLYAFSDTQVAGGRVPSVSFTRVTDPVTGAREPAVAVETLPESTARTAALAWTPAGFLAGWAQATPGHPQPFRALARGGL